MGIARFVKGISTMPPRSPIGTMPATPSFYQILRVEDFAPYRAGDYTLTQTNGTTAAFPWNAGAVQLSTTGGTAADKVFLALPSLAWQLVQGNQLWFDTRLAVRSTIADANMYCGLFGGVDPTAATDGIFFLKPTGGTALNFVIKKGGVTTTFQNIGDLAKPSGFFNDVNSTAGALAGTVAGGALTIVSVATPGSGYQLAPIIVHTTASGSGGSVYVQLGSTAFGAQSFYQSSLSSTAITYGSLYAPYITAGGSAYTNGAASFDVCPLHNLQMYFDGKGRLLVGINNRMVLAIGATVSEVPPLAMVPGTTYNLATSGVGPYFSTVGTQLSTSIAPVQLPIGSFLNVAPLIPLGWTTGLGNTTANPRAMFIDEFNLCVELN